MTDFVFPGNEPDKTDNPYCDITNENFMNAIFGECDDGGALPMVAGVPGDPRKDAAKKHLGGKPWSPDHQWTDTGKNNYFTIARFHQPDDGKYKRQKKYFQALYALVLDDVSEKVEQDKISLEPTWIIETSSGNYQVGYAFDPLITDIKTADALSNAVIGAHLSDPGMSGPSSRLARLPQAINGKYDPPFQCRLAHWNPKIRYSVDEFCNAYGLELFPAKSTLKHRSANSCDHEVYVPKPDQNPILTALQDRRLYKSDLGEGKHDITCPWVHEHTDQIDSGTAYFEPNDDYPRGGFKCLHGHCARRKLSDLLEYLELGITQISQKATIRLQKGMLDEIVSLAEQELASTGDYFQRGGEIVTIIKDANNGLSPQENANADPEMSATDKNTVILAIKDI